MLKPFLFNLSFILVFGSVQSQNRDVEIKKALHYIETRREVCFSFPSPGRVDLQRLAAFISIDHHRNPQRILAYANLQGFYSFLETGIPFTVEVPASLQTELPSAKSLKEVQNWNTYPTYSQYQAIMEGFVTAYPGLCSLMSIGQSVEGREIWMLKISDQVNSDEADPEFLYTSSIHGDELTGFILLLRLADSLLSAYGTSPDITDMLNTTEIYINPLANPDGTYSNGNGTVTGATRFNANGIDLNRNYPDPEDGLHPDGNAWQPENVVMMDFMRSRNFVMAVNFHGGAEVVNYPWDTWPQLHTDNDWYAHISRNWADTVHAHAQPDLPNYMTFLDNGVTNGYAWYSVNGGRSDYANYYQYMREVLIEISNDKMPSGSLLPAFWRANYPSLLNLIRECSYGISGIISDSVSGLPLAARVEIPEHDDVHSFVVSASTGNFHRYLSPGSYDLQVSSYGYHSKTVSAVQVSENTLSEVNVALVPLSWSVTEQEAITGIEISPNPARDHTNLWFNLKKPEKFSIEIMKLSCETILIINRLEGRSGLNSIELPTGNFQPGVYLCRLAGDNNQANIRFIKL